jgi:seryl-tRNA synthetase
MLELRFVRAHPEIVKADLHKRQDAAKLATLDALLKNDGQERKLSVELDALRHRRNVVSKQVSQAIKDKLPAAEVETLKAEAASIPKRIAQLEQEVDALQKLVRSDLMRLPNILDQSVPEGKDSSDNKVLSTWGAPSNPGFTLISHGELAEKIGGADFAGAARVSGAGFAFITGDLARLDFALQQFALNSLAKKGFTIVQPPLMLNRDVYEGVTDLADFQQVMYKIEGSDAYLIATSEHPMAAWFAGQVVEESRLPIKLAGVSPCFRKEIGAHGVDSKGLFRMHQFNKVEQFVFCKPEDSAKQFDQLLENAQHLWRELKIPYRVVAICTGDIGTVAAKKYDIEAWYPREQEYREVVSCSNCTSYQAVGLNVRYRTGKQGAADEVKEYVHTLNSTAIATSRALRAILENYQQPDGSVTVPKALWPYMDGVHELRAKNPNA